MGLGIYLTAASSNLNLFHHGIDRGAVIDFFKRQEPKIPGFKTAVWEDGDEVQIRLMPFSENIYLIFEKNRMTVSARTNNLGPGYHAYLIDLLDELGAEQDLKWDDSEDETTYFSDRDFRGLQAAMADWLASLSDMLLYGLESKDISRIAISMDLEHDIPDQDCFAYYSLGFLTREWVAELNQSDVLRKRELSRQYYIWWEKEADASFYNKIAQAYMWCDCNWLLPYTQRERQTLETICRCLGLAWKMDPGISYPYEQWLLAVQLLEDKPLAQKVVQRSGNPRLLPQPTGFLLCNVTKRFSGDWNLTVPGQMHYEVSEDTEVLWDEDKTIRITSYTARDENGYPVSAEDLTAVFDEENAVEFLPLIKKGFSAKILHGSHEEDGQLIQSVSCAAAVDGHLIIVSCYFEDPKQIDFANRLAASVNRRQIETQE